jgi:hypothetical protein
MNILFLDVDGVLNSYDYLSDVYAIKKRTLKREEFFDPVCMKILEEIVLKYNLQIVITSSWKICEMDILTNVFSNYGLSILDKTNNYGDERGREIREWLKLHKDVSNYIILDDDFFKDYIGLEEHLILTSFYFNRGLNRSHIKLIENIILKRTIN